MFKLIPILIFSILFDQQATTLAMTRKVSGTAATAAAMNTNMSEVEAVVNALTADNLSDDAVTAAKLNADVVRTDYGIKQHTDGSLMVDPSDTNPCIEATDGGVRVATDESSIERSASGLRVKTGGITLAMLATAVLQGIYPVGTIYCNNQVSTNPATLLGFGTWVAIGGKVLVGLDGTTEFASLNQTGGEKTHVLTTAEMPAHTHTVPTTNTGVGNFPAFNGAQSSSVTTGSTGGDGAHNNLQPYQVVYMWYRSA